MVDLRRPPDPSEYGIIMETLPIRYPEYSVVTPQMGLEYRVRGLSVSEVGRIRSSLTTAASSVKLINETIWNALVSKPPEIKTYETFLRSTTIKDREALLHGIYMMTFGSERELRVMCNNCGRTKDIKVNLDLAFSIEPYPESKALKNQYLLDKARTGEQDEYMEKIINKPTVISREDLKKNLGLTSETQEVEDKENIEHIDNQKIIETDFALPSSFADSILSKEETIELPHLKNVKVTIFQPTLKDEEMLVSNIPFSHRKQLDALNETIIIKKITYTSKDKLIVLDDRMQIFNEYQNLPNIDRSIILDRYLELFGKYGIKLTSEWNCIDCGTVNETPIDIVSQFFRMVAIG